MGDEADRLRDFSDDAQAEEEFREWEEQKMYENISRMKDRYEDAKRAETGATILCPNCKKRIIKNTYNKRFCSTKCKDRYWNFVDENRRRRACSVRR